MKLVTVGGLAWLISGTGSLRTDIEINGTNLPTNLIEMMDS